MKQKDDNRRYDLVYMFNGKIRETILSNVKYLIAKSKKYSLLRQTSNYKSGVLLIKRRKDGANQTVF